MGRLDVRLDARVQCEHMPPGGARCARHADRRHGPWLAPWVGAGARAEARRRPQASGAAGEADRPSLVESASGQKRQKASLVSDGQPRFKDVSARVDFPALDARILEFWKETASSTRGSRAATGRPSTSSTRARRRPTAGPACITSSRASSRTSSRATRPCAATTCRARPAGTPTACRSRSRSRGARHQRQAADRGIRHRRVQPALPRERLRYVDEWERITERIGYWVDLDDAYVTFTNDYIETVWWILRQIWDKGLLYQGHKVVPYCPRCGTALAATRWRRATRRSPRTPSTCASRSRPRAAAQASARRGPARPSRSRLDHHAVDPLSNVAAAVHPDVTTRSSRAAASASARPRPRGEGARQEAEVAARVRRRRLLGLHYDRPSAS